MHVQDYTETLFNVVKYSHIQNRAVDKMLKLLEIIIIIVLQVYLQILTIKLI